MRLKSLITRFFLLTTLFIIGGGSSTTYYSSALKAEPKKDPLSDIKNLWFMILLTITAFVTLIGKTIKGIIKEILGFCMELFALCLSNMIAGSYYKRHGIHNDEDDDWWQRVKQRVKRP